jgi:F0F1-type ATP synthase assembly protein I
VTDRIMAANRRRLNFDLTRLAAPAPTAPGERRALYNGFGDALAQAFELVVTPLVCMFIGMWLDGRFGTRPVLTIVLGVLALFSVVAKMYYGYKAAMEREEEGKPWRR